MGSAINIAGYGKFNYSRINKIITSDDKKTALKMGVWDKFKDRCWREEKKSDRLERLWNAIHPTSDSQNTSPPEEITIDHPMIGSVKPGTNLYKIAAFAKLEELVNSSDSDNPSGSAYQFEITNQNQSLSFEIGGEPVASSEINFEFEFDSDGTVTERPTSQLENYADGTHTPQQRLLEVQCSLINRNLPENEKINLEKLQQQINNAKIRLQTQQPHNSSTTTGNKTHFVRKSPQNTESNSLIFYQDPETNESCVLVKPRTYNQDRKKTVASGSFKDVKTSALRVAIDEEGNIKSIQRYVTCSSLTPDPQISSNRTKDYSTLKNQENAIGTPWKSLDFTDVKSKQRRLYYMPYKGELLFDYISSAANLNDEVKFKIIEDLMTKWNEDLGDIKLENTTAYQRYNGESLEWTANFIDSQTPIFTFCPNSSVVDIQPPGQPNKNDKDQFTKYQLFNLVFMFYLMFAKSFKLELKILIPHVRNDRSSAPGNLETLVNNENPFATLLNQTYRSQMSSFNELKDKVSQIIKTAQTEENTLRECANYIRA